MLMRESVLDDGDAVHQYCAGSLHYAALHRLRRIFFESFLGISMFADSGGYLSSQLFVSDFYGFLYHRLRFNTKYRFINL